MESCSTSITLVMPDIEPGHFQEFCVKTMQKRRKFLENLVGPRERSGTCLSNWLAQRMSHSCGVPVPCVEGGRENWYPRRKG